MGQPAAAANPFQLLRADLTTKYKDACQMLDYVEQLTKSLGKGVIAPGTLPLLGKAGTPPAKKRIRPSRAKPKPPAACTMPPPNTSAPPKKKRIRPSRAKPKPPPASSPPSSG